MIVIGVDPGTGGALARYDNSNNELEVIDIPHWYENIGRKKRKRVDPVGLYEYFSWQKMEGVDLVLMEAVGARPRQTQQAGFMLGYVCGLIYMSCVAAKLPIETVSPQVWKRVMQMPGKVARLSKAEREEIEELPADAAKRATKDRADAQKVAIIQRADALFPEHSHTFRGPMGGFRLDRAEAAVLARYAGTHHARCGIANFDGE